MNQFSVRRIQNDAAVGEAIGHVQNDLRSVGCPSQDGGNILADLLADQANAAGGAQVGAIQNQIVWIAWVPSICRGMKVCGLGSVGLGDRSYLSDLSGLIFSADSRYQTGE